LILSDRLRKGGFRIAYSPMAGVLHLKAAAGGGRITGFTQQTQEWGKPYLKLYWLHLNPPRRVSRWLRCFWEATRHGPLRKDAVVQFWRQPEAWCGFFESYRKARREARNSLELSADRTRSSVCKSVNEGDGYSPQVR